MQSGKTAFHMKFSRLEYPLPSPEVLNTSYTMQCLSCTVKEDTNDFHKNTIFRLH